jgi:hypothetical protein
VVPPLQPLARSQITWYFSILDTKIVIRETRPEDTLSHDLRSPQVTEPNLAEPFFLAFGPGLIAATQPPTSPAA